MKPSIKKKWVAALRSGQYQQAKKVLTDGQGFCCLGVLSNLYALEKGEMWECRERHGHKAIYLLEEKRQGSIPGRVSYPPHAGRGC